MPGLPSPEEILGQGSRIVGVMDGGIIFEAGPADANGLHNEVHFYPDRISFFCSSAESVPPLFRTVWQKLATLGDISAIAYCFTAEFQWSNVASDVNAWLAESYIKTEKFHGRAIRCDKLYVEISDQDGNFECGHKIFLEPRAGDKTTLYGAVVQRLQPVTKKVDDEIEAIVLFSSSTAPELIEPYFPPRP